MKPSESRLLVVEPRNNIHKSLRFIFVLAQVFGFFPVQGVLEDEVRNLGFTWRSFRVLNSFITSLIGITVALGHIRHMTVVDGYQQHQMTAVIFYGCGTMSCLLFIKLAKDWKEIMLKWHQLDTAMASYGWPKSLDGRLKRISIIFLVFEAAEHFSIQANKLIVAVQCRGSFAKGFEHYAVNMSFSMIFDTVDYVPWFAIFLQCMNTRMAFSWTFIDLFIILMSCALTARFSQINHQIRHLSTLKVHASLTLIMAAPLEIVYYFISLGLLVLRVGCICLYASRIYEESKLPLDILTSTPLDIYNKEIVRLIESSKYQKIGMTGKKLFMITKGLILKLTAGVIAYELVVIQFSKKLPRKEEPSLYSMC